LVINLYDLKLLREIDFEPMYTQTKRRITKLLRENDFEPMYTQTKRRITKHTK